METHKERYVVPLMVIIEAKHGSIICTSPVNGGNSIIDWQNGGITDGEVFM